MGKNTGKKQAVRYLSRAAIIAALYAALTVFLAPISFGALNFRVAEALCLLPLLFPEAIPGLFVGCLIANFVSPNIVVLDIIFGSLATLAAAVITAKIHKIWLAPLPPVIINAVVIGLVITLSMGSREGFTTLFLINMLSVGLGQLVVCYALGIPLIFILKRAVGKTSAENR